LHIDDRAIIDFEQIARIEYGGVVIAEMGIIAARIGHSFAFDPWPLKMTTVNQNRRTKAAIMDIGHRVNPGELQTAFKGEFEMGLGEGGIHHILQLGFGTVNPW
jgi:hypothetical protein